MSLTGRVRLRLHYTTHKMSEQGEGCVVGFSVALAGGRGLAAGIRGYTHAVYLRRSADRRLPVATHLLEYGDRLRGCAAYPRECGDRLWQLAAHRQKSEDGPCVAVNCDVGQAENMKLSRCQPALHLSRHRSDFCADARGKSKSQLPAELGTPFAW